MTSDIPATPYQLPASTIVHTADTDIMIQELDLRRNLQTLKALLWRGGCGGGSRLTVTAGDDIGQLIKQYELRLQIVQAQI